MNLHRFHYYCHSYLGLLKTDISIFFLKIFQHQFRVEGPTKHSGSLCSFSLCPPKRVCRNVHIWLRQSRFLLTLQSSSSPSHAGHWRGWGVQYQTTRGLVRLGLALGSPQRRHHAHGSAVPLSATFRCEGRRHASLGPDR